MVPWCNGKSLSSVTTSLRDLPYSNGDRQLGLDTPRPDPFSRPSINRTDRQTRPLSFLPQKVKPPTQHNIASVQDTTTVPVPRFHPFRSSFYRDKHAHHGLPLPWNQPPTSPNRIMWHVARKQLTTDPQRQHPTTPETPHTHTRPTTPMRLRVSAPPPPESRCEMSTMPCPSILIQTPTGADPSSSVPIPRQHPAPHPRPCL